MFAGPLTAHTQRLCQVQARLNWLRVDSMSRRRTPDGFSRELHRDLGMWLQRAIFDEWRLQVQLPTDCANDEPATPAQA